MAKPAAFSISQITTLSSAFAEDVRGYAGAGIDGLGVWELKLSPDGDAEALEVLEESGLAPAAAIPLVPSILPLPLMEGPSDPQQRVEAICGSLHRLAPFRPTGIVCLTGPLGDRDPESARETVVEALRTIGDEAERAGVRIGVEPINRVGGENWTFISSIPEAVELIHEADRPLWDAIYPERAPDGPFAESTITRKSPFARAAWDGDAMVAITAKASGSGRGLVDANLCKSSCVITISSAPLCCASLSFRSRNLSRALHAALSSLGEGK